MFSLTILSVISAILLALFWILKKLMGTFISPVAALIFIYAAALLTALISLIFFHQDFKMDLTVKKGIFFAVSAGAIIALFDLITLWIFQKGGITSIFAPLITGGSLILIVLVGILFLRESLDALKILGIFAIIIGIMILAK